MWREGESVASLRKLDKQAIKLAVFNAYGGASCVCCGEVELMLLTLDHVNKDKHRDCSGKVIEAGALILWLYKSGFPKDIELRVLCFSCNTGRQINCGICPHQEHATLWIHSSCCKLVEPHLIRKTYKDVHALLYCEHCSTWDIALNFRFVR